MKTKEIFERISYLHNATKNFVEHSGNFDLENKILFFIYCNPNCCPLDLIEEFKIKKTNLAIICNRLILDKFLIKEKDEIDGRAIKYRLTSKGNSACENNLSALDAKLSKLSDKEINEISNCCEKLNKLLRN